VRTMARRRARVARDRGAAGSRQSAGALCWLLVAHPAGGSHHGEEGA
jgi:hypothetical protein